MDKALVPGYWAIQCHIQKPEVNTCMECCFSTVTHCQKGNIIWHLLLLVYTIQNINKWLTSCSRALLEKSGAPQLVNKFLRCYTTLHFITIFITASHLSLSWAWLSQSTPSWPISVQYTLITSPTLSLGLTSGFIPSGLHTKTLNACLPPPSTMFPNSSDLTWFHDLITK